MQKYKIPFLLNHTYQTKMFYFNKSTKYRFDVVAQENIVSITKKT